MCSSANNSHFQVLSVDTNMSENKDKTPADTDVHMSNNNDETRTTPSNEEGQEARDSTLHELETGLAPAANGYQDQGKGDDGLDFAQFSSSSKASSSSSLNTEDVVAFALECDEEDGSGQDDSGGERAASAMSSGRCVDLAAYFVSTASDMMRERERERKNADMYLAEVTLAMRKIPYAICLGFIYLLCNRVLSGWHGRTGPCARPRSWPGQRTLTLRH